MTGTVGMEQDAPTAKREWRAMWTLPIVSGLGLSGNAMFGYSGGVFMQSMTASLGWTRAQFSSGFLVQTVASLFVLPLVGWLTDRFGPRRIALLGIVPFALCFSMLGLAGHAVSSWLLLVLLMAVAQGFIAQTIWVTAVAGRFQASRGLALAVTLAGLGLASLVWPLAATFYSRWFGWRLAFAMMAASWAVIVLPLTAGCFFGAPRATGIGTLPGGRAGYGAALRSRTFIGLMLAGGLFASAYFGASVHLVPILRSQGVGATVAASLAGLLGLSSIAGRIGTGFLLDRLPVRPVGVAAFLLPAAAGPMLAHAHGALALSAVSIALIGLSCGAEIDVITFIAARCFGREVFASIHAIFMAIIGVSAASGPMIAGAIFDRYRSYDAYLTLVAFMVALGALLLLWIPIGPAATASRRAIADGGIALDPAPTRRFRLLP